MTAVLGAGLATRLTESVARQSTCMTTRGDARIRHTRHHVCTFTYNYQYFTREGNCLATPGGGSHESRLDRRRGGRSQGSGLRALETIQERGDGAPLPSRTGNGLGTAGSLTDSLDAFASAGRQGLPSTIALGCCLSQRCGADGSERALAPGESSIALSRELEQRLGAGSSRFFVKFRALSAHPYSRWRWLCGSVGGTPNRFGTSRDAAAARLRREPSVNTKAGSVGP